MFREQHIVVRPKTSMVELSDLIQRVVATTMRVARSIRELLQLSQYSFVDGCAEKGLYLQHCGHNVSHQEPIKVIGAIRCASHNVPL